MRASSAKALPFVPEAARALLPFAHLLARRCASTSVRKTTEYPEGEACATPLLPEFQAQRLSSKVRKRSPAVLGP